jgi:RNA polymerase sigma-70 factor, ECF subfamily
LRAALLIDQQYLEPGMELENEPVTTVPPQRDSTAFEEVFKSHFKQLHAYAITLLRDDAEAEEMVQQVFFKIWDRNTGFPLTGSVTAYLYRAVHNECLNFLKHQQVKSAHRLYVAHRMKNEAEQPEKKLHTKELEQKILAALNDLPEQCRTIFQLSRFDELKYREIAGKLGLSEKTVENQMCKALKLLRVRLVDFLTYIFLFIHL